MIKLKIKTGEGLALLRPSKLSLKVVADKGGLEWREGLEPGGARRRYPREVLVSPGCYEMERVSNPFIAGGESWLVLKGSRIGAAESHLRRLARVTRTTTKSVEVICE